MLETRRERGRLRAEPGQTMAAGLVAVLVTMLAAAFVVDFGLASLERVRQSDTLGAAEAACMSPACSIVVKNSDQPGPAMCAELVKRLREQGYEGGIEAYYYEPTAAEAGLGDDRRAIVYGATLTYGTPTVFARLAGIVLPETKTTAWAHACAYAGERAWKPAAPSNGVLTVAPGEDNGHWRAVAGRDEGAMPGVGRETAEAIAEARNR